MTQNLDFIHEQCEMCGKEELSLSHIRLEANYGSIYDGERLELYVCGDCMDKMFETLYGYKI